MNRMTMKRLALAAFVAFALSGMIGAAPAAGSLDDQWAIDAFYRIQVTPEFTFGPTVQVVFDPPRNPDDDVLFVGGIRSRIAF